jgi:uncharacterized protein (DUF779 family)
LTDNDPRFPFRAAIADVLMERMPGKDRYLIVEPQRMPGKRRQLIVEALPGRGRIDSREKRRVRIEKALRTLSRIEYGMLSAFHRVPGGIGDGRGK